MLRLYFEEENGARTELGWEEVDNNQIEEVVRSIRGVLGGARYRFISPDAATPLEKAELNERDNHAREASQ